jgi:diguanylate cyclase (GGDEF)-like protein
MKLQHKIPLYVIAVILLVGGTGAIAILSSQSSASTHQFEETSVVLTDTIRNGLEHDMLTGDRDHVKQVLENLSRHETINTIDIVGTNGQVWASSHGTAVGTTLNGNVTTVMNGQTTESVFGDPGSGSMTVIEVVPAQEQCLQCHGTIASPPNAQGNLGAIRADISTAFLEESITESRQILAVVGGLTFILVAGTLVILMRRSVLNPLARVTGVAQRITRGDYTARVPVDNPGNEVGSVGVAFNKMADRVEQHNLDLEKANRELERASRLKSEFLANMSHELRTPLNVIIGFSEVLRDTPADGLGESERRDFCENIISSGYHLLELINDVLDLAKVEAGQMQIAPEDFEIEPVLQDVIATMQPLAAKKGIVLAVGISAEAAIIHADINKFKQILYNLIGNSIKFTPAGGSVDLTAVGTDHLARFAVADTGIGIAPADQSLIFSEFHQIDGSAARQFEGTGLGLALTKKFVEMQGGEIWVESKLGEGSTFFFTMPVPVKRILPAAASAASSSSTAVPTATPAAAPRTEEQEALAPINLEPPSVLVVEDDPKTAKLIGHWLSQEGYDVDFAYDGVEAIEKARNKEHFAVCLDIMLPKKDGWQVLHQIKSSPETAEMGVIICSALDNPDLGFALGAADYCVKPLSRRHLIDKIERLQRISPGRRSTPQVLVADNDSEAAELTASMLEQQGFRVIVAGTGEQARELALEHCPDIVLMDLALAGPASYEITSKEELALMESRVEKIIRKGQDVREQLLTEMFRLEKLNPERARLVDPETRLFNRRYFDKRLAQELNRATRYSLDLSVLLIEMNHPVEAEDSDSSRLDKLSKLAGLLRGNIRAADPLSRFDEHRFAVLLPETDKEAGFMVAGKVVDMVRTQQLREAASSGSMTVSVAVTGCHGGELTGKELIDRLTDTLEKINKRGGDAVQLA